jgi:heme oxygenase
MLLSRLKSETRALHDRVEGDLDLVLQRITPEGYRLLLERFHGFYAPWERAVARTLGSPLPQFFAERRKAGLLAEDLRFFGGPEVPSRPSRSACSFPILGDHARVLGSMYVVEGATLGGQVISRRLEGQLGLAEGRGYSFFRSYGADVGRKWQAFREVLLSHSSAENDEVMVRSACDTFLALHHWLCSPDPGRTW